MVIAARRAETGEPVAEEIRARGDGGVHRDRLHRTGRRWRRASPQTVDRYGGLEIMVHNAFKGGRAHRLEDLDLDLWDENSRTAAWGSVLLCAQIA